MLEKATAFQASDRYRTPEELQIMLESCMDNKYLGGASGAEAVFRKGEEDLSAIERMMVDIIERGPEAPEGEEDALPPLEELSPEEQAGLEKPQVAPREKEDISAMVEEYFGGPAESETPPPVPEEGEDVRVYEPARDRKDRQPIPILTEEKYPDLEPVVLPRQNQPGRKRPEEPEPEPQPEPEPEITPRKKRNLRPLAVTLLLITSLVAGALALNLYWHHRPRTIQLNPTPDPQNYYLQTPPAQEDVQEQTQQEQPPVQEPDPSGPAAVSTGVEQPRYMIIPSDSSWTEARNACAAKDGHLAVISTWEEFDVITRMAEAKGLTRVWIGCHRERNDLVWETDEVVNFIKWGENEPSSWDYDGTPENCIMLYRVGDEWFYNDCRDDPAGAFPEFYSGVMGYVCEFED